MIKVSEEAQPCARDISHSNHETKNPEKAKAIEK